MNNQTIQHVSQRALTGCDININMYKQSNTPRGRLYVKPITMSLDKEDYDECFKNFFAFVDPVIRIMGTYATDTLDYLEENGLMTKKSKEMANTAISIFNSYDMKQKLHIREVYGYDMSNGDKYMLMCNMSNLIYKEIEHDLFILEMCSKQVFDNKKMKNTDALAKIYTTNVLINFASMRYDSFFSEWKKKHKTYDYRNAIREGNMEVMSKAWEKFEDTIFPETKGMKIGKEKDIERAFDIINKKTANYDIINKAGLQAIEYDKGFESILKEL